LLVATTRWRTGFGFPGSQTLGAKLIGLQADMGLDLSLKVTLFTFPSHG